MRVILLCNLNLREETAVQLQSSGQMVKSLFKVTILQVCLTQFGVGCYKNKEVFLVNVDQEFAECKLLNANLNDAV